MAVQPVAPDLEILRVDVEDPVGEVVDRALASIISQTRCDGSRLSPKFSSGIASNICSQIAGDQARFEPPGHSS